MRSYTIAYDAETIGGEPGFRYEIISRGKLVRVGWSRGRRHHAERMARADVLALEQDRAA